jgi:hypothetical protein
MKNINDTQKNDETAKKMLYFLIFLVLPFLLLLVIYLHDTHSQWLSAIAINTAFLPAITSANNPLLSKVMDVYCKTAPLCSLVFSLFSYQNMSVNKQTSSIVLIANLLLFIILCIALTVIFLFTNIELTSSRRILKLASSNDYTLTLFYTILYSCFYVLYCCLFWAFIGICKIIKSRR